MAIKYENLTIIGTSHIAKESLEQVEKYIEKELPDIVALELDRKRLFALISGKKRKIRLRDIRQMGIKIFFLNLIGAYVEEKLGKFVGVKPGSEMKLAYSLAQKHKLKIALIDQNIEITLKRLSKAISWKEKFAFVADLLKGLILRRPEIEIDLTKVPPDEIIQMMIGKVKSRYPNIYRVLIDERNIYMAKQLSHEKELLILIKKELGLLK